MRIAIQGCCHGELDKIYRTVQEADQASKRKTDVLLICGDFQAIRNRADLACLAVPDKYRQMGDFHQYYSGAKRAPLLTIIIGGNHEASNYMWELTDIMEDGMTPEEVHRKATLTGERRVAPSIYYLGTAGSLLLNGLRISGASGIYNDRHYNSGWFEEFPYDRSSIRSIYHIRSFDVFRLSQLASQPPDIFMSHDWPVTIDQHGDTKSLVRAKPFFKDEINQGALGSPPLKGLLKALKPSLWFAAHLHVKFSALYKHDGSATEVVKPSVDAHGPASVQADQFDAPQSNPDEINLEMDDEEVSQEEILAQAKAAALSLLENDTGDQASITAEANVDEIKLNLEEELVDSSESRPVEELHSPCPSAPVVHAKAPASTTKFLALSKFRPRARDYMQIIDVPCNGQDPTTLTFDPIWLAITRAFHPLFSLSEQQQELPRDPQVTAQMVKKELAWIEANLPSGGAISITDVQTFTTTAPSSEDVSTAPRFPLKYSNPQTEALMKWLQLENKINQ